MYLVLPMLSNMSDNNLLCVIEFFWLNRRSELMNLFLCKIFNISYTGFYAISVEFINHKRVDYCFTIQNSFYLRYDREESKTEAIKYIRSKTLHFDAVFLNQYGN